jgi:N-acyl-D-aspartate/D-glutamate deacylase
MLPFHYLSNDPHREKRIPANHASFAEVKRMTNIVRRHGRVWQATPEKDKPHNVIRWFMLSSGRFFGKPLKVTAVAALDVVTNRSLAKLGVAMTRIINSPLVNGKFRLQALAAPFRVYADGMITPLAEEQAVLRELNAIDLEDKDARMALLSDPEYRKRFRKMWYHDKRGVSVARLKRSLSMMDDSFSRDLQDMVMTERPVAAWKDETLQEVYDRLLDWQARPSGLGRPGRTGRGPRSQAEAEAFASFPNPVGDDCDFILHLLRQFDTELRWYVLAANDDEERMARVLFDPQTLPGFSDSGAHLTNMAYYDSNLRGLQIAQRDSLEQVAYHVGRLTKVPAEFWGVEDRLGTIDPGRQADLALIDPEALRAYDSDANTTFGYREAVQAEQMLNRSDGVVTDVWIAGKRAWKNAQAAPELGTITMGQALTA